jgi:transcriptional regulator with XRE-family HTH domain
MAKSIYSVAQQRLQKLLKQARNDAGLTQIELSLRLGKPQSFVSKYESGERRLDLVELHQVCIGLGISLTKFVKKYDDSIKTTV